jgi:hypothetical protein
MSLKVDSNVSLGTSMIIDRQLASEAGHVLFGTFDENGTSRDVKVLTNGVRQNTITCAKP